MNCQTNSWPERHVYHEPNVGIGIEIKDAQRNDIQRRDSPLSQEDVIDRSRVLRSERRDDEARLGECMREGGKYCAVHSSLRADAIQSKLDGERVLY